MPTAQANPRFPFSSVGSWKWGGNQPSLGELPTDIDSGHSHEQFLSRAIPHTLNSIQLMTRATWTFEKTPEMGGPTGTAFTNTLLGTGMEPNEVLARESIQNSCDAADPDKKVKVVFRRVTLSGTQKRNYLKLCGLEKELSARRGDLKLPIGNCIDNVTDPLSPLHLLFIEDYGTWGLHGDPTTSRSHLFRLLLSLGDDRKATDSAGSGGSFGYGKSVYSANSGVHTIFAYSSFEPELSGTSPKQSARLMGCGYFNQHEHKEEEFTGRAWYGMARNGGRSVYPLTDGDAHSAASLLGFEPRSKNQKGTSILIVDCGTTPDELRAAIEKWWWPRLIDEALGLDIEIYDDGKRVAPPRPRKRADLKPFIDCFELAVGRSVPSGEHQKAGAPNALNDKELGTYGFIVLGNEANKAESLSDASGRVALVRAPRMVIEYFKAAETLPTSCVGTFVASQEADAALKRSEPAAHNLWDPKSSRLAEMSPDNREIVRAVLQRIKAGLRRFAAEAAPPIPDRMDRLSFLERLLGGAFDPPTTKKGGLGASPAEPISIHFLQDPTLIHDRGRIAVSGSFRIQRVDEDRGVKNVRLSASLLVQEDEGISREDPIDVVLTPLQSDATIASEPDGSVLLQMAPSDKVEFSYRSNFYNADWTTHFQVTAEEPK